MVNLVEQATLKVVDESSAQLKAVNQALKALSKTAASFGTKKFDLGVNAKGATAADQAIKKLTADMKALQGAHADLKVNVSGIAAAQSQLSQLRAKAKNPIIQQIKHVAVGVLTGAGVRAGLHGTGHALKEGLNEVDIADYMETSKRRSPEDTRATTAALDKFMEDQRQSQTGALYSRAQASRIYTEIGGITQDPNKTAKENAANASELLTYMKQLTAMGYASGQSWESANEGAFDYLKTLDQMGKLTDARTGLYDSAKAQTYFETLIKAQRQSGREMTGQSFRALMSSAQTSKYSLDPDAIIVAAMQQEELGSKAGVGMNEAIKQLTGARLDKAKKARLAEIGLITGTPDLSTYRYSKRQGKMVRGKDRAMTTEEALKVGAVDEEKLRANLLPWMLGEMIPKMRELKLDPTKSADVAKFFGATTSGKGTDYLAGVALRSQELARELAIALRPGGLKEADEDTATSSRVAAMAVKNQFQSVLGETANAMEGVSLPIMKTVSSELSKRAGEIRKGTITTAGALEAAGITTAALGGLGLTAGLRGMLSDNPAIAGLSSAAVALQGSAAALTAAAGVQALAAGKNIADIIGKLPIGLRGALRGATGIGVAATIASLSGDTIGGGLTEEPVERKRLVDLAHARSDLINKQNELNALEKRGTATPLGQPAPRLGGQRPGNFEQQTAGLKADIDKLQAQITQLEAGRAPMTAEQVATITAQATADAKRDMDVLAQERDRLSNLPQPKRKADRKALRDQIQQYQKWIDEIRAKDKAETPYKPPIGWKPVTKEGMDEANRPPDRPWTPHDIGPPKPEKQTSADALIKAAEAVDSSSDKMTSSLVQLASLPDNFTTAFNTLPPKGTEAGNNFSSGVDAPGLGAAMAAAFRDGVAGVRIEVDAPATIPVSVKTKSGNTGSNSVVTEV